MNTRSFLLSALFAGLAIGVLGNLPLLNLINCFLCIWVWLGGFLAVYLYRRYQHGESTLSAAQGAGLGALSGLIGAFIGVVVYALTSFLSIPLFNSLARFFEIEGDLPFQSGGPQSVLASTFIFLIVDVILYPLFGALSGMIAASLFWKEARPSVS
jgi:hypothetical protein